MMDAYKAKEQSEQAQFELSIKEIETAISHGDMRAGFTGFQDIIDNKVARELAKLGYDIINYKYLDNSESFSEASWVNAKKDKKGLVLTIEEIEPDRFIAYMPQECYDGIDDIFTMLGISGEIKDLVKEFFNQDEFYSSDSIFDGDITFRDDEKRYPFQFGDYDE